MLGHNLIENSGCTLAGVTAGNQLGRSARLWPLDDSGGPTATHEPRNGSGAINGGAGGRASPGSGNHVSVAVHKVKGALASGPQWLHDRIEIGYTIDNSIMPSELHLMSGRTTVQEPAVAPWAAEVVRKARAIGLSDESPEFPELTFTMVLDVAERVALAGIAEHAVASLMRAAPTDLEAVAASLRQIDTLIEESPLPHSEWPRLIDLLGREELAGLLGISASSAHRYESGQRDTPDAVAARLHWLALVIGDLEGAYNQVGIRRWFHRRRTALDGRTPAQLLEGDWDPDDPEPRRVRDLARSLIASGAT